MARKHSRLAHTQQRKNIRSAVFFIVLSVGTGFAFLFFGLPTLARLSSFFSDFNKSSKPVQIDDKTPPAPPRFDNVPDATSQTNIQLTGMAEPGIEVFIYFNKKEESVLVDADGNFSSSFSLRDGENSFWAKAKDSTGNESQETKTFTVVFDDDPPSLTITSPADGKEFYGAGERQVVIEGETEGDTNLVINDRIVTVENDGSFTFATSLTEGDNTFNIVSTDAAGNTNESSLTLKYTI